VTNHIYAVTGAAQHVSVNRYRGPLVSVGPKAFRRLSAAEAFGVRPVH